MDKTSVLIYGTPHAGKTSLFGLIAEAYRKADNSAYVELATTENYDSVYDLVKDGTIRVWDLSPYEYPWEVFSKAAEGYWPVDAKDPKSKLAPFAANPDCKARVYEGATTMAEALMGGSRKGGLISRLARGEQIGTVKYVVSWQDGDTRQAVQRDIDYSYVQTKMRDLIETSKKLPISVYWSAHDSMGTDDYGKKIIGPKTVGQASADNMPKQFGPVIYLRVVPNDKKEPEYRAYIKAHYEKVVLANREGTKELHTIPVYATVRASVREAAALPEYLVMDDKGIEKLLTLIHRS